MASSRNSMFKPMGLYPIDQHEVALEDQDPNEDVHSSYKRRSVATAKNGNGSGSGSGNDNHSHSHSHSDNHSDNHDHDHDVVDRWLQENVEEAKKLVPEVKPHENTPSRGGLLQSMKNAASSRFNLLNKAASKISMHSSASTTRDNAAPTTTSDHPPKKRRLSIVITDKVIEGEFLVGEATNP